jgi:hypothetical protein
MKDGKSVFPEVIWKRSAETSDPTYYTEGGMTLRDWFAGQALAGICNHGGWGQMKEAAENCYEFADAMLEAREEQEGK